MYYEHLCPYVRPGGLILFDNTLRGGEVVDPVGRNKPINRAMDALNRKLASDSRIQTVLMPMADGLTICRRLPAPGSDSRHRFDVRRLDQIRLK
jgi:caffeoyl-CoA O-methyltransferase